MNGVSGLQGHRSIFADSGVESEFTDDMDMGCQRKIDGGVIECKENESIRRQDAHVDVSKMRAQF